MVMLGSMTRLYGDGREPAVKAGRPVCSKTPEAYPTDVKLVMVMVMVVPTTAVTLPLMLSLSEYSMVIPAPRGISVGKVVVNCRDCPSAREFQSYTVVVVSAV